MNELTREECLKALDDSKFLSVAVINQDGDIDYKGEFKETVVFDLFDKLIQEHFDNPPLKFEELKEGMWVWDSKNKSYIYIFKPLAWNPVKCIRYANHIITNSAEGYNMDFEENRFYHRKYHKKVKKNE